MDSLWPSLAAELKKELPAQLFETWIKPLKAEQRGDQLVLIAPNHHVLRWIRLNLLDRIESRAERVPGGPFTIDLMLDDRPTETEIVLPEPIPVAVAERSNREEHRLNSGFTFTNFVNGKANQIARAAALQVAENPGTAYNPLFIYGGTGLGKTHLLQAIGIEVLKRNPKAKVRYIHAEQFVADVVRAYQHKSFDSLKRYYRSLDLFLIDDVQFFVGKSRSQEEFFYTFNALFEAHKQVAITSDCFPKEMTGIEERLISRFGWGLTVAVEPPELEMRVAILLKKAETMACASTRTSPSSSPSTSAPTFASLKGRSSACSRMRDSTTPR
jgi:chromosomal replication initiator protein